MAANVGAWACVRSLILSGVRWAMSCPRGHDLLLGAVRCSRECLTGRRLLGTSAVDYGEPVAPPLRWPFQLLHDLGRWVS